MLKKFIFPLWIVGGIALLLYSYTQIDLSLTLSNASIFQSIQKGFQYIGWFNRPVSTLLYCSIVILLFGLYCLTLWLLHHKKITTKKLWIIIIFLAVILTPSYNAFSYDLFNYIFDARIVSFYGLNPYEYKPLDFVNDPMLSFMRSTHRVYPYGPSWLAMTVPLTFISNEIFLVSLGLFKILGTLSFLGTAFFISKIAYVLKMKNKLLPIVLFALNPIVLIEGLVSSHNEIVMMFFAVFAFYLLLSGRNILSFIPLVISIGIKYATAIFLPIFLIKIFYKNLSDKKLMLFTLILGVLAVIITSFASGQNKNPEFQPWYLLLVAPFAALYPNTMVIYIFIFVSVGALLSYVPFLYSGMWPENIVMFKNSLLVGGMIIGTSSHFLWKYKRS